VTNIISRPIYLAAFGKNYKKAAINLEV